MLTASLQGWPSIAALYANTHGSDWENSPWAAFCRLVKTTVRFEQRREQCHALIPERGLSKRDRWMVLAAALEYDANPSEAARVVCPSGIAPECEVVLGSEHGPGLAPEDASWPEDRSVKVARRRVEYRPSNSLAARNRQGGAR